MQIRSSGLVSTFLDRYAIWRDCRQFYFGEQYTNIVSSQNGLPCYHYDAIRDINLDNSGIIVIDCITEGQHSMDFFRQYRTDRHYVIFINGWWNTDLVHLPFTYTLMSHHYFLADMADTYLSPNRFCFYMDKHYDWTSSNREYSFVCTIGVRRSERDQFVTWLQQGIDHDRYVLRYAGRDLARSDHQDCVITSSQDFDPWQPILPKYFHNISQSLPINMYNQADFLFLVETDINFQHQFFLTEKTIKALISGIPFVCASAQWHLRWLKDLGFRTYHEIWDESYDDISQFDKRMQSVVKLANQLQHLDWNQHRSKLYEISQHNRANFLALDRVMHREFQVISDLAEKF